MFKIYPHNKEAYEKVKKMFETENKAAVIHPTGTGKTTIATELIKDNPTARILYLTSTKQILSRFRKNVFKRDLKASDLPNLKGNIYSNLLYFDEVDFEEQFDYIILDEFHRCGAEEWGKCVKKILDNNKEARVLGLTATPIRFLDKERDMAFELFENNIASKMSLAEALIEEILPVPNYITVIESFKKDIDELEEKIQKIKVEATKEKALKKLRKIKETIADAPGLDEIFAKHIEKKDGRLIVFCKDLEHLAEIKNNINNLFGKVNEKIEIFEVHYKSGDSVSVLEEFEKKESDALKIILTVDMLNEGVHLKKLDGIVMLRRTISPIIFLQQLGRVLSVTDEEVTPLVFDVVDNIRLTESIFDLYAEFERLFLIREEEILTSDLPEKEKEVKLKNLRDLKAKFKIVSEMQEATKLINELNKFAGLGFNQYYDLLIDYYGINGNIDVPNDFVINGILLGRWVSNCRQLKRMGNLNQTQIDLLDKLGMIWNKNEEAFTIGYNLAKKYYEENKDLLVPIDYIVDNFSLGLFIRRQRVKYKKGLLDLKKINLLDNIGMVWDIKEYRFNVGYNACKEYYEKHHNLDIPDGYKVNGIYLDQWLRNRRADKRKGKLSEREIKLLEALEIDWKIFKEEWDKFYNEAKKYYEEHKNLVVDKKTHLDLHEWLKKQRERYQKGTLQSDKIELLNKLGMIWNVNDYQFESGYKYAKRYYDEHKNLNVPANYVFQDNPTFNLYLWMVSRRKNKERMKAEHIALLDSLNFDWDPNYTKWLDGYNKAKEYYEENGNLLVLERVVYKDYELGNFIRRNRKSYKDGKLSKDKIKLLNDIGMIWDVNLYKWKNHLFEYQNNLQFNRPISKYLQEWKRDTLANLSLGKLSKEQILLLYAFNMIDEVTFNFYGGEGVLEDVPKLQ